MTSWIYNWRKKQFADVKNADLFKELDDIMNTFATKPRFVSCFFLVLI